MSLVIKQLSTTITDVTILQEVNFTVDTNEIVSIIGPSGAGKTTLLRCIAGLQPYTGSITSHNQPLDALPPQQRNLGFVDQHNALLPHLTIFDNIAYPLRIRKATKQEIAERVYSLLHTFGIANLATHYPPQLSGGEQQRVALARALIYNPTTLLLDEPFGALDAMRRYDIVQWFMNVQAEYTVPTLLVTHNIKEAQTISQRAICIVDGKLVADGSWEELAESANATVQQLLRRSL